MSKIISSVRPKAPVDDQFATRIDDGKSSEVLIWYGRVQPRRIFTYYYNSKKVARGSALEKKYILYKEYNKDPKMPEMNQQDETITLETTEYRCC